MEIKPNIDSAISIASCFAKNPGHQYTEAVKTILQYLKRLQDQEIIYKSQEQLLIEGNSDSD